MQHLQKTGGYFNHEFREKAPPDELLCFHALAHSFERRRSLSSFLFKGFRTLSVTTRACVPPLAPDFSTSEPGLLLVLKWRKLLHSAQTDTSESSPFLP